MGYPSRALLLHLSLGEVDLDARLSLSINCQVCLNEVRYYLCFSLVQETDADNDSKNWLIIHFSEWDLMVECPNSEFLLIIF